LIDLPTPVARLSELGREVGHPDLWVKRDDRSGGVYGGNKPRKLEFLLAEVMRRGSTEIVTGGGDGSNHCVATSLYAQPLGLHVTMVTVSQPVLSTIPRNLRVNHAMGTTMVHVDHQAAVVPAMVWTMIKRGAQTAQVPSFVHFGGSSPRGSVGFVEAGLELAAQVARGELPKPKYIFVAAGSCGTQAGLVLGLRLAGLDSRVVGVRVTPAVMANRIIVATLASITAQWLHRHCVEFPPIRVLPWHVHMLGNFYGGAYGRPTPEGLRAIRLMKDTENITLEPTYTGKALAGMLDWLAQTKERAPVLFWNTYNAQDLSAQVPDDLDPRDLPDGYRCYFECEPEDR
jgi:D-cysteine desulfhydrase